MDLTRAIVYGGFPLNQVDVTPATDTTPGPLLSGCKVQKVSYGQVEVVGYTEKRALDEGLDASDVFTGRRMVTLEGTLYGVTRGDLFDRKRALQAACHPTLAEALDPENKGFNPLTFSELTNDLDNWPDGVIPMQMRLRATSGVVTAISANSSGDESEAASIPWQVSFMAKDPRVYARERTVVAINSTAGTGSFTLTNRGTFPAPLNILLSIGSNTTHDRTFNMAGGGTDFDIFIAKGSDDIAVRIDGEKKHITRQAGTVEVLRMDLRTAVADWPLVYPGDNLFTWTFQKDDSTAATLQAGSVVFFRDAFA